VAAPTGIYLPLIDWFVQRSFNGPSLTKTGFHCFVRHANPFGGLNKRDGSTLEFNKTIIASVACLLSPRRPPHIPWFIITIAVYAINCMLAGWSRANLCQK
jgi:hypothetical protein